MKKLSEIVELISGSPQFRIKEALDNDAPLYVFYGQSNIVGDLVGISSYDEDNKQIRTYDDVNTLEEGDVVFSLISGKATIVRAIHQGYLYTQNFVKLQVTASINAKYLVYLLNEDLVIKRQFLMGLQGSQVLKYTLKQVKDLMIPNLPNIERQSVIGNLYFNQLRLEALKKRAASYERSITIERLKEVRESE